MISEWTNTRKATILFTAFAIAFAISAGCSQAQGLPLMGNCTDANTLHKYTTVNISGVDTTIEVNSINCPYGCIENATIYGDDCMDRPINNPYLNYAVIFMAFITSMILWRMKSVFPLVGATLFFAVSLYFVWYVNLAIGLIPIVLGLMMILESVGRIFKEGG